MSEQICRRCLISGRVQGVGFRASVRRHAGGSGLTGYARNLPDGRVEVLACGPVAEVDELCRWLAHGPALARVDGVDVADVPFARHAAFEVG